MKVKPGSLNSSIGYVNREGFDVASRVQQPLPLVEILEQSSSLLSLLSLSLSLSHTHTHTHKRVCTLVHTHPYLRVKTHIIITH